jgi:hypothetical protein
MVARADDLLAEADILTTDVANGEVRATLGDAASGEGFAGDVSVFGVDGFISRPNDSDSRGAVQAYYLTDGQQKIALGTRDNRFAAQVGALKPGDRAIVTDGPTRFLMKRETALVSLYTESQSASSSKSMVLSLDGSQDTITLQNGDAFIIIERDKISLGVNGGASLTLTKQGAMQGYGTSCALAFGSGTLGIIGTNPPVPGLNSLLMGVSGITGAPSANWTVAP